MKPLSDARSPSAPDETTRRLRVAQVTEYYYPHFGGICEHVHYLARELRQRGHAVDIITSHIGNAPEEPGLIRIGRSVRVPANGSEARISLGVGRERLRGLLRDGGYDLIHVHSPLSPTLPIFAVEAADVPVVGTVHTNFPRSLLYGLLRQRVQRVLDRLDAAIAVSPTAAAAYDHYFRATWRIIPNGVDLGFFHPGVAPPPGLVGPEPSILFLGRLDPRNGLAELIDAFALVQDARPDARLIVVGDGPLRGHYRRLAGANPGIRFEGAVRDARPAYYANCDVYACPTTKASFGITLLEAMACGTAVVCSDIAGFTDVVRHGRNAVLVRMGDARALADALVALLGDPARRLRLAEAGLRDVQQYAWPAVTDQILGVYRDVLRATPRADRGTPSA